MTHRADLGPFRPNRITGEQVTRCSKDMLRDLLPTAPILMGMGSRWRSRARSLAGTALGVLPDLLPEVFFGNHSFACG